MKIKKPKFWDKKQPNLIAILLYPISLIYRFLNNLNKKKIKKRNSLILKLFVLVIYI